MTVPVDRDFDVEVPDGDDPGTPDVIAIDLDVPAGPFLRVEVIGGELGVAGLDLRGLVRVRAEHQAGLPDRHAPRRHRRRPPTPIAVGDVNGDGRLDALIGTATGAAVFLGTAPPGAFGFAAGSTHTLSGGTGAVKAVALADLDGDSDLDAVVLRATTSAAYHQQRRHRHLRHRRHLLDRRCDVDGGR